jgi:hypothetical protein
VLLLSDVPSGTLLVGISDFGHLRRWAFCWVSNGFSFLAPLVFCVLNEQAAQETAVSGIWGCAVGMSYFRAKLFSKGPFTFPVPAVYRIVDKRVPISGSCERIPENLLEWPVQFVVGLLENAI